MQGVDTVPSLAKTAEVFESGHGIAGWGLRFRRVLVVMTRGQSSRARGVVGRVAALCGQVNRAAAGFRGWWGWLPIVSRHDSAGGAALAAAPGTSSRGRLGGSDLCYRGAPRFVMGFDGRRRYGLGSVQAAFALYRVRYSMRASPAGCAGSRINDRIREWSPGGRFSALR